jgi:hypothetical protein
LASVAVRVVCHQGRPKRLPLLAAGDSVRG